jgi:hypothetical protein
MSSLFRPLSPMRDENAAVLIIGLTAPSIVGQPPPAHRTEVAQEPPGIAAVSSTILNEGTSDSECEEDEQSDGTKHGST